jgi:hypothetical protein
MSQSLYTQLTRAFTVVNTSNVSAEENERKVYALEITRLPSIKVTQRPIGIPRSKHT